MPESLDDTEAKPQTHGAVDPQTSASAQATYEQDIRSYRATLVQLEQKNQSEYDKAVMALSGGALGLSFAFLKDVIRTSPTSDSWLLGAWICWGTSVTCVLGSFYTSQQALRQGIVEVDASKDPSGGPYNSITAVLNACGGILFLIGVIFLVIFVAHNRPSHAKQTNTSSTTPVSAPFAAPNRGAWPHSPGSTTTTTSTTTVTIEEIVYGR